MYYDNNGRPNWDRMNEDTNKHRNTCVDRFNPSTSSNYSHSTSNPYYPTRQPVTAASRGHYDGRGQWVKD